MQPMYLVLAKSAVPVVDDDRNAGIFIDGRKSLGAVFRTRRGHGCNIVRSNETLRQFVDLTEMLPKNVP